MNICDDFIGTVSNYCTFKAGRGGRNYELLEKLEVENELRDFVKKYPVSSKTIKDFCRIASRKKMLTTYMVWCIAALVGLICEIEQCECAGCEFLDWWWDLHFSV